MGKKLSKFAVLLAVLLVVISAKVVSANNGLNLDFSSQGIPSPEDFINGKVVDELTPVLIVFIPALAGMTIFKILAGGGR